MTTTLINGKPGETVSVNDRGYQYGDGLFETMAVTNGVPLLWDRHMQRLIHGTEQLGIHVPRESLLREEADQVCHGITRGVLKIILTRGTSGRGYAPAAEATPARTVSLLPWPGYPVQHRTHGVSVQFCRTMISRHKVLAGLKHLNRLEQVMARKELTGDCAEGLMLDEHGHVIEGTMTNFFIVSQNALLTPNLSHSGVEGVMRGLVLERAAELPLTSQVVTLTQRDILEADEMFLTNSLIGLWPVRRIASKEYALGKYTKLIQKAISNAHCAG